MTESDGHVDALTRYLIALCARQTLERVKKLYPDFAKDHRARFEDLKQRTDTSEIRNSLDRLPSTPLLSLLEWFEKWFVQRVEPPKETTSCSP